MVKVRVEDHIKRQAWTSVPAFVIAFVVLLVLGLVKGPQVHAPVPTDIELHKLGDIYHITPRWRALHDLPPHPRRGRLLARLEAS